MWSAPRLDGEHAWTSGKRERDRPRHALSTVVMPSLLLARPIRTFFEPALTGGAWMRRRYRPAPVNECFWDRRPCAPMTLQGR